MRLLRHVRNDGTIIIISLLPLLSPAQFTDKTFDAAFRTLPDGTDKVDSLNKLCLALEDDGKSIACGIKVRELAEKLNYKKGAAQALNMIGVAYYYLDKGTQALEYHMRALKIREELLTQARQDENPYEIAKCKKDVLSSYGNMGNAYDLLGDKNQAIISFTDAFLLSEELKDTTVMARIYYNIASAYLDLPDYYKAIEFGFEAVKLYDAINEKSHHLANALNNIGLGYERLKEFDKSRNYYQKALILQQELGNQSEIGKLFGNIAGIYGLQGKSLKDTTLRKSKFQSAMDHYSMALNILEKSDNKSTLARVYNNIGNIYWELNDFDRALFSLKKSLELYEQLGSQSDIARVMNSLATYYQLQKKFNQSVNYALSALAIADSIHDPEQIKTASEILSDDYLALKQFEKSLKYYKKYTVIKDTLINVEEEKKLVEKEQLIKYEKEQQKMKDEQEKERIKAENEKRTQKLITWAVAGGLLLVVIFSIFILNRWRITQKQKKIIEMQKAEVDTQRELADSRRIVAEEQKYVIEKQKTEVEQQKKMVEEHQKEIIASITYAKRLQEAILPPMDFVKKYFPDAFILYKPKDIVAGDFYWMEVISSSLQGERAGEEVVFIAAADCTGHGVPGAMVSVVCSNALNRTVKEFGLRDTGKILDKVTELVLETFEKSDEDVKDGMDISLLAVQFPSSKERDGRVRIQWSGANNPLWYVQNACPPSKEFPEGRRGEFIKITADKQPIGKHDNRKPFTTHQLPITDNRSPIVLYLFTDGYADQFGGSNGKKFKYKQLEEKLLEITGNPMAEQKKILEQTFSSWQGNLEQVDDVCIIGIQI